MHLRGLSTALFLKSLPRTLWRSINLLQNNIRLKFPWAAADKKSIFWQLRGGKKVPWKCGAWPPLNPDQKRPHSHKNEFDFVRIRMLAENFADCVRKRRFSNCWVTRIDEHINAVSYDAKHCNLARRQLIDVSFTCKNWDRHNSQKSRCMPPKMRCLTLPLNA